MRRSLFEPTVEGEARLLLLIDAFTNSTAGLEGRTKLAKLDFFLRYPEHMKKALAIRGARTHGIEFVEGGAIDDAMIRYRYGPWDPAYFAILGRLCGKGLVEMRPGSHGALSYRTSTLGHQIAGELAATDSWRPVASAVLLLKRYLNLSGSNLKKFVYANFPEVTNAKWGEEL